MEESIGGQNSWIVVVILRHTHTPLIIFLYYELLIWKSRKGVSYYARPTIQYLGLMPYKNKYLDKWDRISEINRLFLKKERRVQRIDAYWPILWVSTTSLSSTTDGRVSCSWEQELVVVSCVGVQQHPQQNTVKSANTIAEILEKRRQHFEGEHQNWGKKKERKKERKILR